MVYDFYKIITLNTGKILYKKIKSPYTSLFAWAKWRYTFPPNLIISYCHLKVELDDLGDLEKAM
jgi:hypothetical protein